MSTEKLNKEIPKITLSIIIRSVIFNCFFYTYFTFFIILVLFPLSLFKSPKPLRRGLIILIEVTLYMFDKIANIKVEERGLENIPKDRGFIYCSKHMSNIDAYFLFHRSPNLTAMAKKELFRIPFVSSVLNKMGVLAVNRGAGEAQKQTPTFAKILLERKIPMIIFAEGTRINVGERKPLKSGTFYYQDTTGLDIIAVSHNSGVFWQKKSWIKLPGTLIVEYHPPMPKGLGKEEFMKELEHRVLDRSNELMLL